MLDEREAPPFKARCSECKIAFSSTPTATWAHGSSANTLNLNTSRATPPCANLAGDTPSGSTTPDATIPSRATSPDTTATGATHSCTNSSCATPSDDTASCESSASAPRTNETSDAFFYCEDCVLPRRKCQECIVHTHREHPFHRIRGWDVHHQFWNTVQLGDLGYELALEHDGHRCPGAVSEARDFVVVHEHGVARIPIVYCNCRDAPPHTTQLMRAGLWPATWEKPRSAITLQALKTFDSLSVNAHTTAHDFIKHLEHLTDVVAPDEVKVREPLYSTIREPDSYVTGSCARVPHCGSHVQLRARVPESGS